MPNDNNNGPTVSSAPPADSQPMSNPPTNSVNDPLLNPQPDPTPIPEPGPTQQPPLTSATFPPDMGGGASVLPPVVAVDNKPKKYFVSPKGRKFVATLFGLLILVGGLSVGSLLVKQQQLLQQKADVPVIGCDLGGSENCQNTHVGQSCGTNGTCQRTSPDSTSCTCDETIAPIIPSISCTEIAIYQVEGDVTVAENWTLLTTLQRQALQPGDVIYMTVKSEGPTGSVSKARFTVNDNLQPEVTTQKPILGPDRDTTYRETLEFYDRYEIPDEAVNIKVEAEVFSTTLNQWL